MSPNEFQLRAALREGEGDGVNAAEVIARAHELRQHRRVRYTSVAAIAVVVTGIGVGGGLALNSSSNDKSSSSSLSRNAAGGSAAASPAAPGASRSQGSSGYSVDTGASAAAVSCPAALPQIAPPASGGGGALFAGPVGAVKICAYPQAGGAPVIGRNGTPVSTVLSGAQATALVASLNGASTSRTTSPCPLYRTADGRALVFYAVSPDGSALPPVSATVAQNPCNLPATNGLAVRYNWTPPAYLDTFVAEARAAR
ncbi:MAG: hypothetical protein QOH14_2552 [Pseudonocardiales bacterium]|jgi:hypothetical protein|nr:hypothetical protein [Pseudonocardiales bacterium]